MRVVVLLSPTYPPELRHGPKTMSSTRVHAWPRRHNAGSIFKRAQGQGRISAIVVFASTSLATARTSSRNPAASGHTRRDWENTLLSDGDLVVRHPAWEYARAMSLAAATEIRFYAS